jgi:hypothetical protein
MKENQAKRELIEHGEIKAPEWDCKIPYQVYRITRAKSQLLPGQDEVECDQRLSAATDSESKYVLPNFALAAQPQSAQKDDRPAVEEQETPLSPGQGD